MNRKEEIDCSLYLYNNQYVLDLRKKKRKDTAGPLNPETYLLYSFSVAYRFKPM